MRLQEELGELIDQNNQLKKENKILKKEVKLLKNNPAYLEKLARSELGLIKEGELVYQLDKSDARSDYKAGEPR